VLAATTGPRDKGMQKSEHLLGQILDALRKAALDETLRRNMDSNKRPVEQGFS
jgi:hypothetical protein